VSSVAAGQRIVLADKNGSLSLGGSCQVTVPAFSSVTLSTNNGMVCANGVRTYGLNGNISNTADTSGLGQFSGQNAPAQDNTGLIIGGVYVGVKYVWPEIKGLLGKDRRQLATSNGHGEFLDSSETPRYAGGTRR
jgi:hypothetical protein